MGKKGMLFLSVLVILAFVLSACAPKAPEASNEPVLIRLWTKEGEADGGFQYVKSLTDAFTAANPNVTFEVVNKEVETLREDFQTSSLAGDPPELLWTVSDHAGPFTAADLIQPVEGMFKMDDFNAAVEMAGHTWGVPISTGNHLMLIYNKDLIAEPPKDTDEFIKVGQELTKGDTYALVFNQTEPFWMVPWLGGFGGSVFAEDGYTPTLDTQAMVDTLQFMYDIKYTTPIIPSESDYDGADALFKEGKAAMIINGDWSLGGYSEALGDKMGVAPIPMVTKTGKYPAPYTAGTYFMLPKNLSGAKLDAVVKFIEFVTNDENQLRQLTELKRLPGKKALLTNSAITSDPILAGSAADLANGVPMPVVLEMRCNWDSMKPEMQAVLADTKDPASAAKAMQAAAEACVKDLE
jgi:arabinogalactan oligomer/maltooligosaccharide transport system substrate-binding protein